MHESLIRPLFLSGCMVKHGYQGHRCDEVLLADRHFHPYLANIQTFYEPGCEADHSPPSSTEVKECVELYSHSPIRLHSVVLS